MEQRIGRIDRNGQESPVVNIYNFIIPGTVDADIYERCLLRIGIFENALGASEDILGKITNDIQSIAINPNLSSAERKVQLQQLAENEIRQMQEEEKLENRESEFFGITLPSQEKFSEDVANASSFWLQPDAMNNLITQYLKSLDSSASILGESPLKTLRTNQDVRSMMLRDSRQVVGRGTGQNREWERWLKGNDPHLAITFDGQCANENRDSQLLTPVHPLIRQAAGTLDFPMDAVIHLSVIDPETKPGIYPFAVFQWELIGLRRDLELVPIALNDEIDCKLLQYLEAGVEATCTGDRQVTEQQQAVLLAKHHALWSNELGEYRGRIINIAKFKTESLNASHKGRIAMLQERLASSTEDKIRRMREAEISRAQSEYQPRLAELQRSSEQADITTERILIGTIEVEASN